MRLKDPSGEVSQNGEDVTWALFRRESFDQALKSKYPDHTVVDYTPIFPNTGVTMTDSEFRDFWKKLEQNAEHNTQFVQVWKEVDELLKLGNNILSELLT